MSLHRRLRALVAAVLLATAAVPSLAVAQTTDDSIAWRFRGEYLHWWTSGNTLPLLATTGPAATPRPQAGVVGVPGTEALFGNRAIDGEGRSGGRVTISRWLDSWDDTALEFVGFYIGDDYQTGDFARDSAGSPILARPFVNAASGRADASLVAYPNVFAGGLTIESYSDMYSAAALCRRNLAARPNGRLDLLGGYRYFGLGEELSIRERSAAIDPGGLIPLGTLTDLVDEFSVSSDFHGAELGVSAEFGAARASVEFLAKMAIGGVFQAVDIRGETTTSIPGGPRTTTAGGLLALPTNIGAYRRQLFGFLPELGVNTKIALAPNVSFVGGYSLLIVNDVLRTGDQIDGVVNTSQIGGRPLAGAPRPAFEFHDSILVLQGINLGLECRW
jgi:hypothetical protein